MLTRTLTLAAILCATACTTDAVVPDDTDDAGPPAPDEPHAAVCNHGRFRCQAQVRTRRDDPQRLAATTAPAGYGPRDLIDAYHVNTKFNPRATIAIVDAYDYPNAEKDLAEYRRKFRLPPCTTANGCFRRVNQLGQPSPLPAATPPPGDDWNLEAALDLQMASAMCPSCELVLVEAEDDTSDGLLVAQDGAASLAPAVISDSWGGIEDGTFELVFEPRFDHPGIGIFASSGDSGFDAGGLGPLYPSTSAHVTAVGGTTLLPSTTNQRGWFERSWDGAGSSCSLSIAQPDFQRGVDTTCANRAAADVSAVADPNTGVAVFNEADGGWLVVGGTSAAAPLVASLYARYGLGSSALGFSYDHAAQYFDVKHGPANGDCGTALCNAAVGWDGPTGIGSPNGQKLPKLVPPSFDVPAFVAGELEMLAD